MVGDTEFLDAVDPPRTRAHRFGQLGDGRQLRGDLVEDQPDLHAGQIGTDAVVRTVAAEGQVGVGGPRDVELERIVEDVLIEVG